MRDLLRHAFASARWSIEGITDEEAFWEPVAACWTVRRRDDGTWRADGGRSQPDPLPITTVAWRVTRSRG